MTTLKEILVQIKKNGGTPYYIGGYVRDKLLGVESKDIDIEVFGLSYETLTNILSQFGKADLVGKSFGVIKVKVDGKDYDFNLPRRDSKNGIGYKGFKITVDHTMTLKEAALRRDFTVNSMSIDMAGNLIDLFNGQVHLSNKQLIPTSEAFQEDAVRLLRGFQFSARFDFRANNLVKRYSDLMNTEFKSLDKSRIWEEWKKWALKGIFYTKSLEYLKYVHLTKFYPEINSLIGLEQDPTWHPEGPVNLHTGFVLDHMHQVCERENITGDDRLVMIFSALCHDMGKAVCTERKFSEKYDREVITSHQHEKLGGPIARKFLESIGCPVKIIDRVIPLVENHMVANQTLSDRAIKRLSARLGPATIKELSHLIEADQCGRPPLPKKLSDNLLYLIYKATKLGLINGKPEKLVTGQDVVDSGFEPGPIIGKIVKKLYEMQLNESFMTKEQGLSRISSFIRNL